MGMRNEHMVLAMAMGNNFGSHPGAWRMPHADVGSFTDIDAAVRQALTAERGDCSSSSCRTASSCTGTWLSHPPCSSWTRS